MIHLFYHIRNLKQALNHGWFLKKVHKVIKFNQNVWLKPYTDPRERTKNDFEKNWSWWIMHFMEKV